MKTRKIILACALLTAACHIHAQESAHTSYADTLQPTRISTQGDSIIIRRGEEDLRIKVYKKQTGDGRQKEVELFEGVYLEEVDADKRTFLDALPFIPRRHGRQNSYEPHCSGVFIGYSGLGDDFLSFGAGRQASLNLSQSWEFGFNILSTCHKFRGNPHWGINFGLNWGYRSFKIDGNRALLKAEDACIFAPGDEETTYGKSRLRHFFFRIPVLVEWQQKSDDKFFLNAGAEFEIRHGVKSFTHINGGKRQTVGKGMYTRPVGINLPAQAGYGNLGFYLRYSMNNLFQKDKGPEVAPYAFGVAWYW